MGDAFGFESPRVATARLLLRFAPLARPSAPGNASDAVGPRQKKKRRSGVFRKFSSRSLLQETSPSPPPPRTWGDASPGDLLEPDVLIGVLQDLEQAWAPVAEEERKDWAFRLFELEPGVTIPDAQ